jgi:prepilin-type processing-associated H-X9-DG protein
VYCTHCGIQIPDDARFCTVCGTKVPQAQPPSAPTVLYAPLSPASAPPGARSRTAAVVVVAVVLVGLLLATAVFAKAREKARQVSCLANVKQIDLGLMMYCSDWGDRYPRSEAWNDAVALYIGNEMTSVCPSAQRAPTQAASPSLRSDYLFNDQLSQLKVAQIVFPAEIISTADSQSSAWNQFGDASLVAPRHGGGYSAGFADGHAKWIAQTGPARWDPGASSAPAGRPPGQVQAP